MNDQPGPSVPASSPAGTVLRFHPHKLRIVGGIFSAALVIMVVVGWLALPAHLRALFTPFQLITLLTVLVVIVGLIAAIALSSVRADADGVSLRNGISSRRLAWSQVHRVVFRDGDPWPVLLVGDPDDPRRQMVLGIQRNDGRRATAAVDELRRLHATANGNRR